MAQKSVFLVNPSSKDMTIQTENGQVLRISKIGKAKGGSGDWYVQVGPITVYLRKTKNGQWVSKKPVLISSLERLCTFLDDAVEIPL